MRLSALTTCAALLTVLPLGAQNFTTHPCASDEDHGGTISRWFNGEHACEVRLTTFPLVNGHFPSSAIFCAPSCAHPTEIASIQTAVHPKTRTRFPMIFIKSAYPSPPGPSACSSLVYLSE